MIESATPLVGCRSRAKDIVQEAFVLPAYGVMDAAVFYTRGRFRLQVNLNNVLDERYFVGSYNDLYVLPGEPLNVRATVSWAF